MREDNGSTQALDMDITGAGKRQAVVYRGRSEGTVEGKRREANAERCQP